VSKRWIVLALLLAVMGLGAGAASAAPRDANWADVVTRTAKLNSDGSFTLKIAYSCTPHPDYGPFLWIIVNQGPVGAETAWWDVPGDATECDGERHVRTYLVSNTYYWESGFTPGPVRVHADVEFGEAADETITLR
jgi:hypothetical protein